MMEAQEMFRTSNKVTRPEKALILGFMAGSRGKFCKYIVTWFLSLLRYIAGGDLSVRYSVSWNVVSRFSVRLLLLLYADDL